MNASEKLSEVTKGKYVSCKVRNAKRKKALRKASVDYVKKSK